MGFYGNITNTSKTQFTFDRIYANRATMDSNAISDGVFIGRYVLVEYDSESVDFYQVAYRDKNNNFYLTYTPTDRTRLRITSTFKVGSFVRIPAGQDNSHQAYNIDNPGTNLEEIWKCTGSIEGPNKEQYAICSLVSTSDTLNYSRNYAIDVAEYGPSRGYDSTVWQKTLIPAGDSSIEKYVMIAELNSVVPSFGIVADAPTESPLQPHFDQNSTNVYYKLHWQPQWGFRLKVADHEVSSPELDSNGLSTSTHMASTRNFDNKDYPSDLSVLLNRTWIDTVTGQKKSYYFDYPEDQALNKHGAWIENKTDAHKTPVAVYFNKDGFDPAVSSYSSDNDYNGWINSKVSDEISITATGKSGTRYLDHDGTDRTTAAADIQEMSVMLPSLGDTLAQVWDLVYGDRAANEDYNASQKTRNKRNMNISWSSANQEQDKSGLRLIKKEANGFYTYNPNKVNTIAGAINSVHDLMGMIIVGGQDQNGKDTIVWPQDELQSFVDGLNDNYIYLKDNKFYRKHKTYEIDPIDSSTIKNLKVYEPANVKNWNNNSQHYYYKDSDYSETPGYILDKKYYPDRKYVTGLEFKPVELSGKYKKNTYYTITEKTGADTGGPSIKYNFLQIDQNENYKADTNYYSITKEKNVTYQPVYFYGSNVYYIKDKSGKYVLDDSEGFSNNQTYYIQQEEKYIQVPRMLGKNSYSKGKFYSKQNEFNYIQVNDNSPSTKICYYEKYVIYYPGMYYYALYQQEGKLTQEVYNQGMATVNNKYYIKTSSNTLGEDVCVEATKYDAETIYYTRKFVKDNDSIPQQGIRQYFSLKLKNKDTGETIVNDTIQVIRYKQIEFTSSRPYQPNLYYYIDSNGNYVLDANDQNANTQYYIKTEEYQQVTNSNLIDIESAVEVNLLTFANGTYYYKERDGRAGIANKYNYTQVNEGNLGPLSQDKIFYTITLERLNSPYEKNTYYYRKYDEKKELGEDQNGSYLLGIDDWDAGKKYYVIKSIPQDVTTKYYAPNKYYYKNNNGEYILATNEEYGKDNDGNTITPTYYIKSPLCVKEDANGVLTPGTELNPDMGKVPDGVTVGIRKEKWELQELEGFSDTMNTMMGQILQIHKILENGDKLTRDLTTVQGSINSLNDIIAKFNKMVPGELILVDEYGRYHSAPITTSQKYQYTNWQDSIGASAATVSQEKQFINLNINSETSAPSISLLHNTHPWIRTTTVSDKNTPKTTSTLGNATGLGNNNNITDIITFDTPIVDNTGHVVGRNTESLTLPYGLKSISVASSTGVSAVSNTVQTLVATKTQDVFNLKTGNKWINIAGNNINKTITLGHSLSDLQKGEHSNDNTKLSLSFGDSFNIPIYTTDEAGHVTGFKTESLTLPKNTINNQDDTSVEPDLVITKLELDKETNGFITSSRYIGDLILSNYEYGDPINEIVEQSDRLETAIMKLQSQILVNDESIAENFTGLELVDDLYSKNLVLDTDESDTGKVYDDSYVYAVKQESGKVSVKKSSLLHTKLLVTAASGNIPAQYTSIYSLWETAQNLESLIEHKIADSIYASTLGEYAEKTDTLGTEVSELKNTIATLTQRLTALETDYTDLETRITDLENKYNRPAG